MSATRRVIAAAAMLLPTFPALAGTACHADSGSTRGALVELYTSEGCSSCPPADQRLHDLTKTDARVVPLALHVDYWDSTGWVDRFAQPSFTERQRWEVQANRHRTSFTPHFFVNGREVLDWRAELDAHLRPVVQPAPARISIDARLQGARDLQVTVQGSLAPGRTPRGPLQLFVAVTESGLSTQVRAGENRGVRLEHDAVARTWIGPIAIAGDHATFERVVPVSPSAGGHVAVVAFIQDATTAEVLQAAGTGVCEPG